MEYYTRQPRLLLVEDQPIIYETLQRRLEEQQYRVTLATTYEAAYHSLTTEHFHLAIIDLRLNAADENDLSGMRLLQDVERLNLRGIMPCLIITAYGTIELVIEALQDLGVEKFIEKRPGYIAKLLAAIPAALEKYKLNFGLEFAAGTSQKIEQGASFIHANDPGWPPVSQLAPQIEDILSQLFDGAQQLWIDRTYEGLSGSFVVRVLPTWASGPGQSRIVKIGRRDKIDKESRYYHDYVEHHLAGRYAVRLNAAYARHLGGLLYPFVDAEDKRTITFADLYRQQPPGRINAALQQLFRETCQPWYQNRTFGYQSLRDLYWESFDLTRQPERLPREIATVLPGYDQHAPTLTLSGTLTGEDDDPPLTLPNPLYWLAQDANVIMPVCCAITHGDLHADNILINDDDCWLIDFYRTYPSHILRDFVELETDIKYRLSGELVPADFLALEQALIKLEHPPAASTRRPIGRSRPAKPPLSSPACVPRPGIC